MQLTKLFLAIVMGIALGAAVRASSQAASFEVATIKANHSPRDRSTQGCNGIDGGDKSIPVGRCVFRNVPLKLVLALAFEVPAGQMKLIDGGPSWLDTARYDIEAKSESLGTQAQLHRMLQTLLIDRLKLKVHQENKQLAVFALLEANGGHKMKKSEGEGPAEVRQGPGGLDARMVSMAELTAKLAQDADIPIIDMTGLKGRYDLKWNIRAYFPADGKPDPLEIMKESLPIELGLRLDSRQASVEVLVIDHVEKPMEE